MHAGIERIDGAHQIDIEDLAGRHLLTRLRGGDHRAVKQVGGAVVAQTLLELRVADVALHRRQLPRQARKFGQGQCWQRVHRMRQHGMAGPQQMLDQTQADKATAAGDGDHIRRHGACAIGAHSARASAWPS